MTAIVLDRIPHHSTTLALVGSNAGIRDQYGHLLGDHRLAVRPADVKQYECPVPDQELDRRACEGGGRALSQILADLESAPRGIKSSGQKMRKPSWHASGLRQMTGTPWGRQRTDSITNWRRLRAKWASPDLAIAEFRTGCR